MTQHDNEELNNKKTNNNNNNNNNTGLLKISRPVYLISPEQFLVAMDVDVTTRGAMIRGGGSVDTDQPPHIDSSSPPVCDHEHFPVPCIDETFNIGIEQMFSLLFTDSKLFQCFIQQRNTYDVRLDDWVEGVVGDTIKTRTIHYTLSINYSIGPKCSPSTEVQRMLEYTRAGQMYVIDADCYNGGVPYADSFYTSVRYCMRRLSQSSTRLSVSGRVVYRKKMLGLIKNFIEKTAHTGIKASFSVVADLLRLEAEGRGPSHGYQPHQGSADQSATSNVASSEPNTAIEGRRAQRRARRRLHHQRSLHDNEPTCDQTGSDNEKSNMTDWLSGSDALSIFLLIMVLFLLCFHLILFNQLSTLEHIVQNLQSQVTFSPST